MLFKDQLIKRILTSNMEFYYTKDVKDTDVEFVYRFGYIFLIKKETQLFSARNSLVIPI